MLEQLSARENRNRKFHESEGESVIQEETEYRFETNFEKWNTI